MLHRDSRQPIRQDLPGLLGARARLTAYSNWSQVYLSATGCAQHAGHISRFWFHHVDVKEDSGLD